MERYATVVVDLAQAAVLPVLRTAEVVSSMAGTQSEPAIIKNHEVTS